MKTVKVIVERGKDNRYSAFMDCHDFDFGLAGFGSTAKDAISDFYQSHDEEKQMCLAEGKPFPELKFDIRYDICSFLDYYAGILSKSGLEKVTGINQKQLWHYASGSRRPSEKTVRKIDSTFRHFVSELEQVHFI
jgi:hypothetical protein